MEVHVKVVGAIQLVVGATKILTGVGILVLFLGLGVCAGLLATQAGKAKAQAGEERVLREGASPPYLSEVSQEEREWIPWLIGLLGGILGGILGGGLILWGAFRMVVGLGLLRFRGWARAGAVILAVIDLPGFPFFTLFGVYTLWAVLGIESKEVFLGRSSAAAGSDAGR
jgi:hypothetical protein